MPFTKGNRTWGYCVVGALKNIGYTGTKFLQTLKACLENLP